MANLGKVLPYAIAMKTLSFDNINCCNKNGVCGRHRMANKRIGFEVARAMGKSGYVVLLGARDPTTGREAANTLTSERLDVRFVELDVTRMETISAAAA